MYWGLLDFRLRIYGPLPVINHETHRTWSSSFNFKLLFYIFRIRGQYKHNHYSNWRDHNNGWYTYGKDNFWELWLAIEFVRTALGKRWSAVIKTYCIACWKYIGWNFGTFNIGRRDNNIVKCRSSYILSFFGLEKISKIFYDVDQEGCLVSVAMATQQKFLTIDQWDSREFHD